MVFLHLKVPNLLNIQASTILARFSLYSFAAFSLLQYIEFFEIRGGKRLYYIVFLTLTNWELMLLQC